MRGSFQTFLTAVPTGPIEDKSAVERLMIDAWSSLDGSTAGGMQPQKLRNRMESVVWYPPILTFTIERHGGTVHGSTRGELQHWQVNIEAWTAEILSSGRRQLKPASKRFNVRPLAESVANEIVNGLDSPSLKRFPDGRIKVQIGTVVPNARFQQTTAGRRKRFRLVLEARLLEAGWVPVGVNTYQRQNPP